MGYKDAYRDWLSWCDDAEKKELLLLKDEKEIEDRFYRDLEFGTAGLRGIMGAGSIGTMYGKRQKDLRITCRILMGNGVKTG